MLIIMHNIYKCYVGSMLTRMVFLNFKSPNINFAVYQRKTLKDGSVL